MAQLKPLTQAEYVKMLFDLQKNPAKVSEVIDAVRGRGIAFALTDGLRGLTTSKSANNQELKRALEEANRRRQNPTTSQLPSTKESSEVLEKAREATLLAVSEMPDFLVKQVVLRSIGYAGTNKFTSLDRLVIAVGYRVAGNEEYRVLSVNGIPQAESKEKMTYEEVGGTTSAGEFVTVLATIFKAESDTKFTVLDTDVIRGRRAIVYSFDIERDKAKQSIVSVGTFADSTIAGMNGKVWIDRENHRVLRIQSIATEIPSDFPIRAASRNIDYDWVTINNQKYLLPSLSEVRLTARQQRELYETRNEIRFRDYRKFDVDIKILDDEVEVVDEPKPAVTKP